MGDCPRAGREGGIKLVVGRGRRCDGRSRSCRSRPWPEQFRPQKRAPDHGPRSIPRAVDYPHPCGPPERPGLHPDLKLLADLERLRRVEPATLNRDIHQGYFDRRPLEPVRVNQPRCGHLVPQQFPAFDQRPLRRSRFGHFLHSLGRFFHRRGGRDRRWWGDDIIGRGFNPIRRPTSERKIRRKLDHI